MSEEALGNDDLSSTESTEADSGLSLDQQIAHTQAELALARGDKGQDNIMAFAMAKLDPETREEVFDLWQQELETFQALDEHTATTEQLEAIAGSFSQRRNALLRPRDDTKQSA